MGYWVVRTYESGSVGEKTKFWIPGERPKKSGRREKSEIKKQEQNEYSAVKTLARLLNANYGAGDILLGLDYSDKGIKKLQKYIREKIGSVCVSDEEMLDLIREAATREVKLCLRRVKRELEAAGISLKYIFVTSDMDGDTGEVVRIHHHLVINREALTAFKKKWSELGGVAHESLKKQADYTPLAEYLLRQVRRVPDEKKYVSSRNLIRPQPRDRIVLSDAELRPPRGGKLLHRNEYKPGRPQYIRYILPVRESTVRRE